MKKLISVVLLATLLTNCVHIKDIPLSVNDSNDMKGKKISIVSREKQDLVLKTPFHVALLGGALVYLHMTYLGNKIVKENEVEDTSLLLAKKIQSDLVQDYKLIVVDSLSLEKTGTSSVNKISNLYSGISDYVIDVRTINWGLNYVPMDLSYYAVEYSAQLRLIDVKNSKVIAENSCVFKPNNSYSKREILSEKAKILKQEFDSAVDVCFKLFKDKVFSIRK